MLKQIKIIVSPTQILRLKRYLALLVTYCLCEAGTMLMLVPFTHALMSHNFERLKTWLVIMTAAVMATCLMRYWQTVKGFALSVAILRTIHARLGQHIARLPFGWFSPEVSGQVSRCATSGAMGLAGALSHLLPSILSDIAVPLLASGAMLVLDWRLGAVALGGALLVLHANSRASHTILLGEAQSNQAIVALNNRIIEFARCQATLRAFCQESAAYTPIVKALEAKKASGQTMLATTFPRVLISGLSVQLVFALLVAVGLCRTLSGGLAAPKLIAFLVLAARFSGGLSTLGARMGALNIVQREIARLAAILSEPSLPEALERRDLTAPGSITFQSVDFGFSHSNLVLHNMSFELKAGSVTGLIGPSGAGKSTILKLLMRFYDPAGGQVFVGGVDLRDLPTEQLMDQIALVSQDVYLFAGSIEDNIRIGKANASESEWREAARLARVDELVARREHGWATQVGEGGRKLSGGERQRIALARALLKRAPILLLDEASSALDAVNVAAFQDALNMLRGETTILMITHQAETTMRADRLLIIESGRLIEEGSPRECYASEGYFYRFCQKRRAAMGWRLTG